MSSVLVHSFASFAVPTAFILLAFVLFATPCSANDKGQYHFLNPTPQNLLRDMSTDRPDKTESAYTVDAGHFQLEMDIANYSYTRDYEARSRSWNFAPINIKAGLLNNVDIQFLFDSYTTQKSRQSSSESTRTIEGVGDIITRLKVNIWGNDDGATALAVMPFVKFPTNSNNLGNDSYEGGVILPLAIELSEQFGLGLMSEVDILRNEDNSSNRLSFINTITIGHDFSDVWGGYLEFFSLVPEGATTDWEGTLDAGVTYALTEDLQFDAGVNVGVTRTADDLNPFIGLSWRL